MKKEAK